VGGQWRIIVRVLYWEVVMGSAEDAPTAEATVNEAVSAFQGIGTLA
jgi:hypothetical protein